MNEGKQVNIFIQPEEYKLLTDMMLADRLMNRSAFIRYLIRQEYARRHTPSLQPTPNAGQANAANLHSTCGESANG